MHDVCWGTQPFSYLHLTCSFTLSILKYSSFHSFSHSLFHLNMKREQQACVCESVRSVCRMKCFVGRSDIVHVVAITARPDCERTRPHTNTKLWRHLTGCSVFNCNLGLSLSGLSCLSSLSVLSGRDGFGSVFCTDVDYGHVGCLCVQQVFLHQTAWPHWLTQANRFSPMNRFSSGGIRSSTVIHFSWKSSVVSMLKQHIENL